MDKQFIWSTGDIYNLRISIWQNARLFVLVTGHGCVVFRGFNGSDTASAAYKLR